MITRFNNCVELIFLHGGSEIVLTTPQYMPDDDPSTNLSVNLKIYFFWTQYELSFWGLTFMYIYDPPPTTVTTLPAPFLGGAINHHRVLYRSIGWDTDAVILWVGCYQSVGWNDIIYPIRTKKTH